MTPKPTSFRLDSLPLEKLAALAKLHKRSQTKELEYLIEQEFERANLKIDAPDESR